MSDGAGPMSTATATAAPSIVLGAAPLVYAYARKSPYKSGDGKGSTLGVDNQHEAIETYVRDRIHPDAVIVRFTDEKRSAYLDKPRPEWERLLRAIDAGEPDHVVGWHTDRMARRVEATGRLWALVERVGTVALHTTFAGHITDPMGLYLESIMAENESRQRSRRLRLKHDALGRSGGFSGGQRRYGYTRDMSALVPDEADVIREIVGRVLNGESLGSVARSLNERGIPTARGYRTDDDGNPTDEPYRWHQSSVGHMLTSPHLAALRMHNGNETAAQWPEVIDVPTWRALNRKLTDPSRLSPKSPTRRYLLSGIARCGMCNAPVRGTAIRSQGLVVYRCRECKGFQRNLADVDAVVREWAVARLEEIDATGTLVSDSASMRAEALSTELDALAAQRAEAASLFAARTIDGDTLGALTGEIATREAGIRAELDRLADEAAAPERALDGATGPDAGRVWDEWTNDPSGVGLTRQRAIVSLLLNVWILPLAVPGRRVFDPDSVHVEYR
jgi:site-specific DNA recombinase